tara:strand:+ start:320 stop:481 length:162 start_codon:yes stop_codon:yes gene_type:complete
MNYGYIDLIVLIIIFIGLQLWWIIPLVKRNNDINKKNPNLIDSINFLEKMYKK